MFVGLLVTLVGILVGEVVPNVGLLVIAVGILVGNIVGNEGLLVGLSLELPVLVVGV